ncbi:MULTISPECIES: GntR family transcriptional regulator [Gracilibacillus]|uniref:GntR family transcriptional regulator n=1 Tax=Gracilibacillus TaxID=74385 RepID=UPI000B2CBE16|nr:MULTISPECIES: GntR family transcriptional regulator [Gracilibacillus]
MDKASKVPLYLQLMDELILKMDNKELQVDQKLPSERELCEIYNLSRITVRSALQELEREGYIYKLHGKGTFVSPVSYHQKLIKLYSFTDEMKKLGKTPTTQVLSFQEIALDERLAHKMNVTALDEVFQIVRLRLADQEPLIYETSYLPKETFPGLTKNDLNERPMYEIFRQEYQIHVTKAVEHFSASSLRKEEADYLQLTAGSPAMLVKRLAYHNDQLIEYTVSVTPGDKFNYTVELT